MQLQLVEKRPIQSDIVTFIWQAPEPTLWRAGQYGVFYLDHSPSDTSGPERFFTISSAPHEPLAFTTRITNSSYKQALAQMEPGQTIDMHTIGGDFVIQNSHQSHIFVAGGIGITPFRSILTDLHFRHQPINIKLLYLNQDSSFLFQSELDTINAQHPELEITYSTDTSQLDATFIQNNLDHIQSSPLLISGPISMIDSTEEQLVKSGAHSEQFNFDYFEYDWDQIR